MSSKDNTNRNIRQGTCNLKLVAIYKKVVEISFNNILFNLRYLKYYKFNSIHSYIIHLTN